MAEEKKVADNHCPYGCGQEDLDENGACRHLVGFTNDGKTFEPLIVGQRGLRVVDANRFDQETGLYSRNVMSIQAGDELVNPEFLQMDQQGGGTHKTKKWVSARVYRKRVQKEVPATA